MSSVVRRGRPALVAAAAAVGVLAGVAGCTSSPGSSSASAAATSAAATAPPSAGSGAPGTTAGAPPSASMTPLPAAAGQLTGTQLVSALLPVSDFPAGYAAPSGGPVTSGGALTSGPATYPVATVSCATFVQHFGTVGFGETAMVSGSASAASQAFDEVIYQFATGSEASSFASGIGRLGARCGSFKVNANGQTGTFSIKTSAVAPVGGHQAVDFTETGTLGGNKVDLDLLVSASGVDVFAAGGVGASGTAAPTKPARDVLVWNLMRRQAAVAELD